MNISTDTWMLWIILAVLLFGGEPDIADSLRILIDQWAVTLT